MNNYYNYVEIVFYLVNCNYFHDFDIICMILCNFIEKSK